MKKLPVWLIVLLILGILIASKQIFFPKKNTEQAKGPGGKSAPAVPVNFVVAKKSAFSNDVFATGKIGAFNQVDILPEVAGRVVSINFKEGETVAKGSLLIKLNDADLQAQLEKNSAQLKMSEQKLKRLEQLIKVNGISQEEFDLQENEVKTLNADRSYIQAQLAKTNITAPFSGQAGLRNISEGAFVNNNTPVVSLVQMLPLYVEFSLPEKYSSVFQRNAKIKFSAEQGASSLSHEATVYAIEPMVDETTRSIRARAKYSGTQSFFPGSFVKVYVDLGKTEDAILIPSQAVIATLKGQKIFVARSGIATEVQVQVGVRTDKYIQVTQGIAEGDTVLTTGLLSLKKDTKIKLVKAAK